MITLLLVESLQREVVGQPQDIKLKPLQLQEETVLTSDSECYKLQKVVIMRWTQLNPDIHFEREKDLDLHVLLLLRMKELKITQIHRVF